MPQPVEPEPAAAPESESPFSAMDPEMAANPQPLFKALREATPVMAMEGAGVIVSGRAEVDEAFRRPEIFSSNMSAVDLGNIRPLIPLQIDPPEHKKYRRILDPIFAPKQMALLEEPVSTLANGLIDGFIDRGELDFAAEFSVPFPSQVFLTLLGLPLDDLPIFLAMKDGIIRPGPGDGVGVEQRGDAGPSAGHGRVDLRLLRPGARRARGRAPRRHPQPLPRQRGRRAPPHARGDPRHLLPVPHRRARHRDRHPGLHVLLPGPASRAAPPHRGGPVHRPVRWSRSSCAGRPR